MSFGWFVCISLLALSETKATGDEENYIFPPEGYNKIESGKHDAPRHVNFSLVIESVIRIDATMMEFVLNSYIVQEWTDERLKRDNHHEIVLQDDNEIWTPDIYCLNCRQSTLGTKTGRVLLRIGVDGRIYHSQPGLLHAACNFKFQFFPFDVQYCDIEFASYSHNSSVVQLFLKDAYFLARKDLEQFTVEKDIKTSSKIVNYLSGNYTVLQVELKFMRQIGFYLIRIYFPTIILVCLCWIAFCVSPSDIETRLTIGITLILSMIFLLGYSDTSLPKVSYIKAIDWFMIVSLVLIVLIVLESVGVYWYLSRDENEQNDTESKATTTTGIDKNMDNARESNIPVEDDSFDSSTNINNGMHGEEGVRLRLLGCNLFKSNCKNAVKKKIDAKTRVAKFELVARIAFPLVFFVFAVIYGRHYTQKFHE